jgi:hypothetical protein
MTVNFIINIMNNNSNTNILSEFKSFYENKNYEDALTLLHENRPKFDPGVYEYNIGLIYMKQDHYVLARINFEKAKEFGFMTNELNSALNEAKSALQVTVLEDSSSTSDSFNEVLFDLPKEIFFSVSILLLIVFTMLYKRLGSLPIKLVGFIVTVFPIVFYFIVISNKSEVVLLEDHAVRRGPSTMFEEVQLVPKGMKVFINDEVEGWNFIVHPKSHQGWIKTKSLERI